MKRRAFLAHGAAILMAAVAVALFAQCDGLTRTKGDETVVYIVLFDLIHPKGSPKALLFMEEAEKVATSIPVVTEVQRYQQGEEVGDYHYCLLLTFRDEADYALFVQHPAYSRFFNDRWETEVMRFKASRFTKM